MKSIIFRYHQQLYQPRRNFMVHTKPYAAYISYTAFSPSSLILPFPINPVPPTNSYPPLFAMKRNDENIYKKCPGTCGRNKGTVTTSSTSLHETATSNIPTTVLNGAPILSQQQPSQHTNGLTSISSSSITPTATKPVPKNTFYRRSLPDTCIAFSSKLGRTYFESAMKHRGLKSYFHLMEQYTTQSEPAYCGISTLVIALNALAVDPRQIWKGSWRWYEESMLNCCIDLEQVKETGITMEAFNCLSLCQGLITEVHYVDEEEHNHTDSSSLENFRQKVMEACVESNYDVDGEDSDSSDVDRVLIASYDRKVVGQTGSGHFSPIAAYDQESDSVLIMDTARFKYGAHWVKLPLIYEAMKSIDKDTGRSRGYVMLVHRKEDDTHRLPNLPMAVILRSEMKQSETRRQLKEYLSTLGKNISFDDIANFFYKDGSYQSIWDMVLPQLRPYDNDLASKQIIDEIRSFILLMLNSIKVSKNDTEESVDDSHHCRANHCRTIALRTEEAILVVYLACLDVTDREKLVLDTKYNDVSTEPARLQLLAEAELVRYAIDMSDQIHSAVTANPSM